jgi:hypothetical protein
MSDPSVDREMEANQQRANNTDNDDDGSVVDSVEQTVNPLTRGIDLGGDSNGGDGDVDPDQQRRLNDAEQRPS